MRKNLDIFTVTLLVVLFIIVLSTTTVKAESCTFNGVEYYYEIENSGVVIIGGENTTENMVIPSVLDGYPVIGIGHAAFYKNSTIKSLSIPDSIKYIEESAFNNCSNLESVNLGQGVEVLGTACFCQCIKLKEIILPDSLLTLENDVFNECFALETINLPNNIDISAGGAFLWSGLKSITIPGSISVIGNNTFAYCFSLESVTLEEGIKQIDKRAFANCPVLKSIVIPDSVERLGTRVFCYDSSLESISFGKNLKNITFRSFTECFALEKLIIPNGVETIEASAFEDNPRLREVYLPASVTYIGGGNFGQSHYHAVGESLAVIYGERGSYAEEWANDNNRLFREVNANVSISTQKATMKVNEVLSLFVLNTLDKVTWSSSNINVATVNEGLVTGRKAGKATITAKVGSRRINCEVTVKTSDIYITGLSNMHIGQSYSFRLLGTVRGATWESSDKNIASIIKTTGLVTANKKGNCTISVKVGTKKYKFNVNVQVAVQNVVIDKTNFPDNIFRKHVTSFDKNKDGILSIVERLAVTDIEVNAMGIGSLKGIEYFPELLTLECSMNNLSELNVSKNTKLIILSCTYNRIKKLDLSNNKLLDSLYCGNNKLTFLDISQLKNLFSLSCYSNQLDQINLSKNTGLTELSCSLNNLMKLDISKNTKLITLDCYDNQLKELDVAKNPMLEALYCGYNFFETFDISRNTILKAFNIAHCWNNLTTLDLSKNLYLEMVHVSDNYIMSDLDLSYQSCLKQLFCSAMKGDWQVSLNSKAILNHITELDDRSISYVDRMTGISNTTNNSSSNVLSGKGIELFFSSKTTNGGLYSGEYVMVEMGKKRSLTADLGVIPLSSIVNSANIGFRCYRKANVTVTFLIENARIETESNGKVYKLNTLNGKHVIKTIVNTWDSSAVYVYGSFDKILERKYKAIEWRRGVFKADVTIISIK